MGVTQTRQSISDICFTYKIKMQDGHVARRAVSLTEILPDAPVPQLHDLFWHDSETGLFHPDSVDELIKDSRRLRHATKFLGISDIEKDLQRRMALLQQCVEQKAYGIPVCLG